MSAFQAELQVPFNQQLENPHVIKNEQVFISIMKQGVNENQFSFTFQNKDNTDMVDDLAYSIATVAKTVPGGILVFFPSYGLMNKCYE